MYSSSTASGGGGDELVSAQVRGGVEGRDGDTSPFPGSGGSGSRELRPRELLRPGPALAPSRPRAGPAPGEAAAAEPMGGRDMAGAAGGAGSHRAEVARPAAHPASHGRGPRSHGAFAGCHHRQVKSLVALGRGQRPGEEVPVGRMPAACEGAWAPSPGSARPAGRGFGDSVPGTALPPLSPLLQPSEVSARGWRAAGGGVCPGRAAAGSWEARGECTCLALLRVPFLKPLTAQCYFETKSKQASLLK